MSTQTQPGSSKPSIARGIPLSEEQGIGALTVPGYLREVTGRFAANEALVHRCGGKSVRWTYAELWERACAIARALIACGVGRDSRVGILMTNRPEFLAAVFGTSLAGGVFVPLNTFSTPSELEHLVQASEISLILFERKVVGKDFGAMLRELEPGIADAAPGRLMSPRFPFLRRLVALSDEDPQQDEGGAIESWETFLAQGASTPPGMVEAMAAATRPADTGAIFFSSGTTSLPKGIVHSHRAIALQWWRWPWMYTDGGEVRTWTANGFFWSGPFSLILGIAFSTGGAIILQSAFNATEALDLLQAERVTVPVARKHQWARIEEVPGYASADLSHLRCFEARTLLHAVHPSISSVWHGPRAFGTTETLTNVAVLPPSIPLNEMGDSYGPPLAGNIFKIISPETGEIVPLGQRGELALKGPTLMLGYLGKTADECFDAEGFYRTGDAAWLDEEGKLFWDGRLTDMIKTGGANVAPDEVDRAISAFPGVKLTQTVGVPDDMLSEIVVSCIVPREGATIDEAALRTFLKGQLASYKIPRHILLFREDQMSLTGSGAKIKAGEVRTQAMQQLAKAAATKG